MSSRRLLALFLPLFVVSSALAQTAGERRKTADEEIEEAVGPTAEEDLVVTASRVEESILEAPVAVSVIGPEVLETTPADNYADLLRGVPGLNVIQMSARDINFTSRNAATTLSTSQLALVDGRSVYQDFFGFVMWDVLPFDFDEIRQIEILRGPGSAIWGPNALAGVINVRTKSPRELEGGMFRVGAGEQGTRQAAIRWADVPSDTFSYKISASYYEQEDWPRPTMLSDGTPLPTFANRGTEQPKLDLRFDHDFAEGRRWIYRLGTAGTAGIIHTGIGPFEVDDSTGFSYAEVEYEGRRLGGKFYVNYLDGDATNLLNGLDFDFQTTTYVGDVVGRHQAGDHHLLVFGGDVRFNDFDLSIAPGEDSRREFGVFFEDQIIFNEHVLWNLGARVDDFDTIGTVVSPRTSLILKPNPRHAIRFAFNRAYRAPSLVNNFLDTNIVQRVDLDLNMDGIPETPVFFPSAATGNLGLEEETTDAYEIGYTAQLCDRATLSFAIYRNEVEQNIDFFTKSLYSPADPPPVLVDPTTGMPLPTIPDPALLAVVPLPKEFSYRNVGSVRYQGVELGLNVEFAEGVFGSFSYTYQDEPEVTDNDPIQPFELGLPPQHQFAAGVSFEHDGYFGSLGVTYTDEAFWSDVLDSRFFGETDDFFLVNGSFGVELAGGRARVAVHATNILDEDVQQHVFGDIIGRKVTVEFSTRW